MLAVATALGLTSASTASAGYFHSPTGRIQCFIGRDVKRPWAACYNALTLRITARDDCGSGASVLAVRTTGRAVIRAICNPWPRGRRLAYGRSLSFWSLRCTSRFTGMTCRSLRSGHGFFLNRDGFRRF